MDELSRIGIRRYAFDCANKFTSSRITAQELARFLRSQASVDDRQTGSHLTLRHEANKVSATVPIHAGCDIGCGLAVRILKDAGFSVDDYLRLR